VKAGVTATREGLSPEQRRSMTIAMAVPGITELHHGDCIGGDADAHGIAENLGLRIVVHPPVAARYRAWTHGDETREPLPYLERNHAIVDVVAVLFAAPSSAIERRRSGTWATIRYAREVGRRLVIVFPNGEVQIENPTP